jgi:hypothetical protein
MANSRVDVVLDEPGVTVSGGGPHGATLLWQPYRVEELAEGRGPALGRRRPDSFSRQTHGDRLRLATVTADGVPSTALLARQGIYAVVVDDIEAVFALDDVGHASSVDHFEANPTVTR